MTDPREFEPDPPDYEPEMEDDWRAITEWTTWTDEQANAALRIYDRRHGVYPYRKASDADS